MTPSVHVIIPCYKVRSHVLDVITRIGPEVEKIWVVDDACPESTGDFVASHTRDPRVHVLWHAENQGVGGAVMTGYTHALAAQATVLVKIDGDGQMDPSLISRFIAPILTERADYTKGNRFYDIKGLRSMPMIRLLGNAALSFMAKFSTGYWNLFDINNGYTAIHAEVLKRLDLPKISKRYFFETDILFRLNIVRAVVVDIPMDAIYGEETSNLKIRHIALEFLLKHFRNMIKRLFYNYFLRDMTVASIELIAGLLFLAFGFSYGIWHWVQAVTAQTVTPLGTIMLSALPTLMGIQFLLAFIAFDVSNIPRRPVFPDFVIPTH